MLIEKLKRIYLAYRYRYRYRYRLKGQKIRLLLQNLGPAQLAADVAAHKGAYTCWLRRAVGACGSVYAFEPQHRQSDPLQEIFYYLENLGCEGFFIARDGARPMAKFDHELHQVDHRGRNYVNNFPFPASHRSEA